jgi:hypothetical protein
MNKEKKFVLERIVNLSRYCDGAAMCSEMGKPLYNFSSEMDAELQMLHQRISENWDDDE